MKLTYLRYDLFNGHMRTRDAYDPVNYDYSERLRVVGARSNKMFATDVNVV